MTAVKFVVRAAGLAPSERLCISGNSPPLGSWLPDKAILLENNNDNWCADVVLPSNSCHQYRIFTAFLPPETPGMERLSVIRWEASATPRYLPVGSGSVILVNAEFGNYEGVVLDDGWLLKDSEVHFTVNGEQSNFFSRVARTLRFSLALLDLTRTEEADSDNAVDHWPCWISGFKISWFDEEADDKGVYCRVGVSVLLGENLKELAGNMLLPVLDQKQRIIGDLSVEYLIIKPLLGVPASFAIGREKFWTERKTGADFVEFDVQLTKDLTPIVYHDFFVCLWAKKRTSGVDGRKGKDEEKYDNDNFYLHRIPLKELELRDLQQLQIDHSSFKMHSKKMYGYSNVASDDDVPPENQPFPLLCTVLQSVAPSLGFNIEIKYPQKTIDAEEECEFPLERNDYVDSILTTLLRFAGSRQIVFSSFDADICLMLKMKQNRYHVLFLTQGKSQRYIAYMDKRTQSSEAAVHFAFSNRLSGIVFHSEEMLTNVQPFHLAKAKKLVCFAWGNDLDNAENIERFTKLGFDGVIYDRIDLQGHTPNQ